MQVVDQPVDRPDPGGNGMNVGRRDVGLPEGRGVNGQLLMPLSARSGQPWAEILQSMGDGVARCGPVRAGVYAMTTAADEKVAGV